jgi:hypothetical protein
VDQIAEYRHVAAADIDLDDNRYNLDPFASLEDRHRLLAVRSAEILHPPLLLEEDNRYLVVAGVEFLPRNLQAAGALLTALVIDRTMIPRPVEIFTLLLHYCRIHTPLSPMEQGECLARMHEFLTEPELIEVLPLLGHGKKKHLVDELMGLRGLDRSVQLCLHEGLLNLRSAAKISRLAGGDQQTIVSLVREFQLGGTKQQQLIERMTELSKRLQCRCEDLVTRWREEEKERQLNGPQRAASLLRWLDHNCFPQYRAAEQEFSRFCKTLQLPATVRVEHEVSFENDRITLCMDFANRDQLAEQWPKIRPFCRK